MKYGSAEFAGNNVLRVVSCLSPDTHFASGVKIEHAAFSFHYGNDGSGSEVIVEFNESEALGAMVLKVTVEGY